MNTLLFDQDYMSEYYNCSSRTYDEWKDLGNPNVGVGFLYLSLGIFYLALLLPFMLVFLKSNLMRFSCYKIMFYIGFVDTIAISIAGFYCGYAASVGMIFCMAPTLNYVVGSTTLGVWGAGSSACMLLAINRCIDLISPQMGQRLFDGKKTVYWLSLPSIWGFYFFFIHTSVPFNSQFYAWIFDPFAGTPERNGTVDAVHYPYMVQSVYNILVIVVLLMSYSYLLIHLSVQTANLGGNVRISRLQKQTFIQSIVVCSATFVAASIYTYMNFFRAPLWASVLAEVAWQSSHGAAGVSYAFLNPTLRRELFKICFAPRIKPTMSTVSTNKVVSTADTSDMMQY